MQVISKVPVGLDQSFMHLVSEYLKKVIRNFNITLASRVKIKQEGENELIALVCDVM